VAKVGPYRATAAVIALAWAATAPAAQQSAAQVTDAQVSNYKRVAAESCREGGKKQGDPEEQVNAFCGCLMDTLDKSMSAAQWREVVSYSLNKQPEQEAKVLTPHLAKAKACAPKPPPSEPAAKPSPPEPALKPPKS
jgi:hypothetical protein